MTETLYTLKPNLQLCNEGFTFSDIGQTISESIDRGTGFNLQLLLSTYFAGEERSCEGISLGFLDTYNTGISIKKKSRTFFTAEGFYEIID